MSGSTNGLKEEKKHFDTLDCNKIFKTVCSIVFANGNKFVEIEEGNDALKLKEGIRASLTL